MKSILASFLLLLAFVGLAFLDGSTSAVPCGHASFTYCDESGAVFPVHTFRPETWTPASPVLLVSGSEPLSELAPMADQQGALIVALDISAPSTLSDEIRDRIFARVREETGARCDGFQRFDVQDVLKAGL